MQRETGLVCMVGHTRRFNPSHQWIHRRIAAGELSIQQMDVQTYFFRRKNLNALGEPRSWTDHLLWHHAAHTVDLFQYQTGEDVEIAHAVQGPIHPELGIAMDMSIQLRTPAAAICTLSLSFNNDGPLGTFFRYICDNGTYIARYDDLVTGREEPVDVSKVDVSTNGIELQDREFVAAIREGREPNSSVASVLPCYRVLGELDTQLARERVAVAISCAGRGAGPGRRRAGARARQLDRHDRRPSGSRSWPQFRRQFRLLRYEYPGHGGSAAPPGPYTVGELGAAVLGLLDEHGIGRARYCGISLGGMVGMWLAANAPDRIDALGGVLHVRVPAARAVLGRARAAGQGRGHRADRRAGGQPVVHSRVRARGSRTVAASFVAGLAQVAAEGYAGLLRGDRRDGPAARHCPRSPHRRWSSPGPRIRPRRRGTAP